MIVVIFLCYDCVSKLGSSLLFLASKRADLVAPFYAPVSGDPGRQRCRAKTSLFFSALCRATNCTVSFAVRLGSIEFGPEAWLYLNSRRMLPGNHCDCELDN